jgi:hypothetical protein
MSANVTVPPPDGGFPGSGDRFIRGTFARWNDSQGWIDRDGLPLPEMMFVIGHTTVLQRWKNGKAEVKTTHPLPDVEELNKAVPVQEWELGLNGKPRPPWELTFVVYMIELKTAAIYTYANSTFGAMLAYNHLEEQIDVMRMLRGEHVLPIVRSEKRPMKTQFGMKTRPHWQIVDWRTPRGSGPVLAPQSPTPQLSSSTTATSPATDMALAPVAASTPVTAPAAAAASTTAPATSMVLDSTNPVKPATMAEIIADELPWK